MLINIDKAKAHMGETLPLELTEDASGWDDPLSVPFAGPVRVLGSYRYSGNALFVEGTADAVLDAQCDLCLSPVSVPVKADFSAVFRENPDESEGEYGYTGREASLNKMILDELSMQMPARFLCREDCRGLCPICGHNRNEGDCGCRQEDGLKPDNPFEKLKSLF